MRPSSKKGPKPKHNGRVTMKACKNRRGLACSFTSSIKITHPDGRVLRQQKICSWCTRKKP